MQEELQYPQVTKAQYDLWLADPTTQKYLQCIKWSIEQNKESMGNGDHLSDNPSETNAAMWNAMGRRAGYSHCESPYHVLDNHNMLEVEDGA